MQVKIVITGIIILIVGLGLLYFQNYEIIIGKDSDSKIIQQNNYISKKKNLKEGDIIKVNFKTNGIINFFIQDSTSFKVFEKNNVNSLETKFKVKYESEWQVIFQHSNKTSENISIQYTIEYSFPISNHWIVSQGYIFIIIIGVFVFIGGIIEREEKEIEEKKEISKVKKEEKKEFYIETDCTICNKPIKELEKTYLCQCGCIIHENCAKKVGKCASCGRLIK